METVAALEAALSAPSPALISDLAGLDGDIIILGCAGKMGPTLAIQAQRALHSGGSSRRVIAVSRFSDGAVRARLDAAGVATIAADLHQGGALAALPDVPNVIYMLGTKFGTTGQEYQTWATNAYLGGRAAERYAGARIVVFSSGNVYPLLPVTRGGATEATPPAPVGEYAQSCLARERLFEHFSRQLATPVTIFRLNYAIDLRYGVLLDIGRLVFQGQPIELAMGNVNVIWQGDASEIALRALTVATSPPKILNVTGPEVIAVRWIAGEFARRFGVEPAFTGEEAPTALLNNAAEAFRLFGYPRVTLGQMIDWTAAWIQQGGPVHDKPTHFQEREGNF
jgi:nucleoside-diphosphate-sugar epimerase